MKHVSIAVFVLLLTAITVYAQDNQRGGDITRFTVDLGFEKYPPTVGANNFTIRVKDIKGDYITNADITVDYYMTERMSETKKSIEMPRHGAQSTAKFKNSAYESKIDFTMPGPWIISVKIEINGITEITEFHHTVK